MMSGDSFTEITEQSWFSRIGGSIKGILVGLILIVISVPMLFLNEGRAVKRAKTLKEGSGEVISIPADTVSPENSGKLVHVTGMAETTETLMDDTFNVSISGIHLRRNVEMYQWKESVSSSTKKKVGGKTTTEKTYSYKKVWSDDLIDSSDFKKSEGHENPGAMPYQTQTWSASDVVLGKFRMPPFLISKIRAYQTLSVTTGVPETMSETAKPDNGGFYIGKAADSPEIGDLRVTFEYVPNTEVSLIAQQVNNTFEPFTASTGGTIELLESGTHSAQAMFQSAQAANKTLTWVLRLVGFFLMFVGFTLIFKPLSVVADVLPILGSIVGAGTGFVAFLISALLSTLVIGIAWIVYRPLIGILLFVVAGVFFYLLIARSRKQKKQAA